MGVRRSRHAESLFILDIEGDSVCVVTHVDDLLLFGIKNLILRVKDKLASFLKITDLGECRHFLCISKEKRKNRLMLKTDSLHKSDCRRCKHH